MNTKLKAALADTEKVESEKRSRKPVQKRKITKIVRKQGKWMLIETLNKNGKKPHYTLAKEDTFEGRSFGTDRNTAIEHFKNELKQLKKR